MNREQVRKVVDMVIEGWSEGDHPRDKDGKFVSDDGPHDTSLDFKVEQMKTRSRINAMDFVAQRVDSQHGGFGADALKNEKKFDKDVKGHFDFVNQHILNSVLKDDDFPAVKKGVKLRLTRRS